MPFLRSQSTSTGARATSALPRVVDIRPQSPVGQPLTPIRIHFSRDPTRCTVADSFGMADICSDSSAGTRLDSSSGASLKAYPQPVESTGNRPYFSYEETFEE